MIKQLPVSINGTAFLGNCFVKEETDSHNQYNEDATLSHGQRDVAFGNTLFQQPKGFVCLD